MEDERKKIVEDLKELLERNKWKNVKLVFDDCYICATEPKSLKRLLMNPADPLFAYNPEHPDFVTYTDYVEGLRILRDDSSLFGIRIIVF